MIRRIRKLLVCEGGATAAEYVLILAIVGIGIAAAATVLGGAIATEVVDTSTCISAGGGAC